MNIYPKDCFNCPCFNCQMECNFGEEYFKDETTGDENCPVKFIQLKEGVR